MLLTGLNDAKAPEESKNSKKNICGSYCKHLTAKQQKNVVLRLIKLE